MIRKPPNDYPGLLQHPFAGVAIFAMNPCLCIIFPCFVVRLCWVFTRTFSYDEGSFPPPVLVFGRIGWLPV